MEQSKKMQIRKGYRLYYSNYMIFLSKDKTTETVKDQWFSGVWLEERMSRMNLEDFQGSETIPYHNGGYTSLYILPSP